jgi:DNA-binding CsgD family transcriptional regulator
MQIAPPLALYRASVQGDTAAFAQAAFEWLHEAIGFDAGMLVTTFADRPAFLDAHFTGFNDVGALMRSWAQVSHLDVLTPRLLAEPGIARHQCMDDPLFAGPESAPLRAHLDRFGVRRTLCIALRQGELPQLTVILLARHDLARHGSDAELARLTAVGPLVSEAYAACRALALLRSTASDGQALEVARIDARGRFEQTTPAFAHALWAGAAPQDVHLDAEALKALKLGRVWRVPGRELGLHAVPDGEGWLLRLRRSQPADALSARERQIARRYASGESHQQIASALHLAPATVRNHLSKVYLKLAVHHRAGLIAALSPTKLPDPPGPPAG